LSITGPSRITELREGRLSTYTVTPEEVGLSPGELDALLVADPAGSASAIKAVLHGEPGPRRNHAVLNGAAALVVAGLAEDLAAAVPLAEKAIDSGAAGDKLRRLLRVAGGQRKRSS
jgi:anthranilate phosphoribosyltransferase